MDSLRDAIMGFLLIAGAMGIASFLLGTINFGTGAIASLNQDLVVFIWVVSVIVVLWLGWNAVKAGFDYASAMDEPSYRVKQIINHPTLPNPHVGAAISPPQVKHVSMPGTAATAKSARLARAREKVLSA